MTEESSALYPPGPAGSAPAAWLSTLRTVLEHLTASQRGTASAPSSGRERAETLHPPSPGADAPDDHGAHDGLADTLPLAEEPRWARLAERLRALSPEAADVPSRLLDELLETHHSQISSLTDSFGLDPAALLVALGRGLVPGELDPIGAAAVTAGVPAMAAVIATGSVAVDRDGRSTTLIAAATVGPPRGPVRLTDAHWERHGLGDVWLCAVSADPDPLSTAQNLFERILPQAGVLSAHLRTSERRRLHVGIRAVAADADPDLVMGRLEGWRSAVGQLSAGRVDIVWEQA